MPATSATVQSIHLDSAGNNLHRSSSARRSFTEPSPRQQKSPLTGVSPLIWNGVRPRTASGAHWGTAEELSIRILGFVANLEGASQRSETDRAHLKTLYEKNDLDFLKQVAREHDRSLDRVEVGDRQGRRVDPVGRHRPPRWRPPQGCSSASRRPTRPRTSQLIIECSARATSGVSTLSFHGPFQPGHTSTWSTARGLRQSAVVILGEDVARLRICG